MPVLVSPWLSTHVSLIMMSYALFAFMMAERHTGIVSSPFSPDVDAAQPIAALSRRFLFGSRHFSGCGFGPMLAWGVIGLGPEGVWR